MLNTLAPGYVLALDLGTTGNRAILFDAVGEIVSSAYKELTQYYPQPGWLEHDPREIYQDTCWVMQAALQKAGIAASEIAAIGLSVQRETCLLWDKTTGQPLHNAIVWQDRRTARVWSKVVGWGVRLHGDKTYPLVQEKLKARSRDIPQKRLEIPLFDLVSRYYY